jgi:hypothetical protein
MSACSTHLASGRLIGLSMAALAQLLLLIPARIRTGNG